MVNSYISLPLINKNNHSESFNDIENKITKTRIRLLSRNIKFMYLTLQICIYLKCLNIYSNFLSFKRKPRRSCFEGYEERSTDSLFSVVGKKRMNISSVVGMHILLRVKYKWHN